jgi:RNA polymerase sigma factor (TIGR02999 family)
MLRAARAGDRQALDDVFARVYAEVREIAQRQLRRVGSPDALHTTSIVHEAYLKLFEGPAINWEDRAHFYSVAAMAMRQILLNRARRQLAKKRGGGARVFALDQLDGPVDPRNVELLELDSALHRLSSLDERLAQVVDLRYFAGLSIEETAQVLGVTDRTVKRDWQTARAFLFREIYGTTSG